MNVSIESDRKLFNETLETFVMFVHQLRTKANCHIPVRPQYPGGDRYIRIAEINPMSGNFISVYCFVDKTNGDLLKGTWKAPVKKGKRGNLFSPETWTNFDHHGPKYLR